MFGEPGAPEPGKATPPPAPVAPKEPPVVPLVKPAARNPLPGVRPGHFSTSDARMGVLKRFDRGESPSVLLEEVFRLVANGALGFAEGDGLVERFRAAQTPSNQPPASETLADAPVKIENLPESARESARALLELKSQLDFTQRSVPGEGNHAVVAMSQTPQDWSPKSRFFSKRSMKT